MLLLHYCIIISYEGMSVPGTCMYMYYRQNLTVAIIMLKEIFFGLLTRSMETIISQ